VWRHHVKASALSLLLAGLAAFLVFPSAPSLASTSVESQICDDFEQPLITAPADGTHTKDASVMVTGTGEPTMTVMAVVNGSPVATGSVAVDGTFGLSATLQVGQNSLLVKESNDCGTTKQTSPITVVRDEEPVPETPGSPPVEPPQEELPGGGGLHQNIPDETTSSKPSSGYPKPIITTPTENTTTRVSHILVAGTAYRGSLVTIYVNGVSEARVIASADGRYQAQVNLDEGKNQVRVYSQFGKQGAFSDIRTITFTPVVASSETKEDGRNLLVTVVVAGIAVGASVSAVGVAAWGVNKLKVRLKWWK
jgi:hypothetical protein